MGNRKKFIDKKNSETYQLLPRDSSDTRKDDSPGNDRIFVRIDRNAHCNSSFFSDTTNGESATSERPPFFDGNSCDGDKACETQKPDTPGLEPELRREILELGFPDDGYNYLEHLRDIRKWGNVSDFLNYPKSTPVKLPPDLKAYEASQVDVLSMKTNDAPETRIYDIAGSVLDARNKMTVDPEVSALFEDAYLSEKDSGSDELEEDFVVLANMSDEEQHMNKCKKLSNFDISHDLNSEFTSSMNLKNNTVPGYLERKVRYLTVKNGSLPSESEERSLDLQFDLVEQEGFGTEGDESDGFATEDPASVAEKIKNDNNLALKVLGLGDDRYRTPADLLNDSTIPKNEAESVAGVLTKCAGYAKKYETMEDEEEDVIDVFESDDSSDVWDCETIVSTYSNLDNHPARIGAPMNTKRRPGLSDSVASNPTNHVISLHGKESMPAKHLPSGRKSTKNKANALSGNVVQQKSKQHGNESKEEKKERKAAVKEQRRKARRNKKEMKTLYCSETCHAHRVVATAGPSSIPLM